MANWAIGDIQGCLNALKRLLTAIKTQDTQAKFYFCGDLVNRGEDSLGTLQYIQTLGNQAHTVLGNHDLYALACAAGFLKPKKNDTFREMLAAPQLWVDWLRQQPLVMDIENIFLLSHAGVWPSWNVATTLDLARSVENSLCADDWATQLNGLWYGNARLWQDDLAQSNPLNAQRFTINSLMRMRLIAPDGGLDFEIKESAEQAPAGYIPWFEQPNIAMQERVLVFGHWSALGLRNTPRLIALDTGCVWGQQLTAVELLPDVARRRIIQVAAHI
jgi:bis(5'-nucleosyl)-tetraphosphatase (symmetrical)